MSQRTLLQFLRETVPASSLPIIVSALRMNPLFWRYLDNNEIQATIQAREKRDDRFWFPERLALLQFQDDQNSLMSPVSQWNETLKTDLKSVIDYYETESNTPADFRSLTLFALMLHQDWQKTGNTLSVLERVAIRGSSEASIAILSIIFGLSANPEELVQELCRLQSRDGKIQTLSKLLLSMPFPAEEQQKWLVFAANALSACEEIEFLKYIHPRISPEVFTPAINLILENKNHHKTINDSGVYNVKNAQSIAELYTIVGDHEKAFQILKEASQYSLEISSALAEQSRKLASIVDVDDKLRKSVLEEARVLSSPEFVQSHIEETPLNDDLYSSFELDCIPWDLGIVNIDKYYHRTEDQEGYIRKAISEILRASQGGRIELSEGVSAAMLAEAIPNTLCNDGFNDLVNRLLDEFPNDKRLLEKSMHFAVEANDIGKANDIAELLILLEPDNLNTRRISAKLKHELGKFQEVAAELNELNRMIPLESSEENLLFNALFELGLYDDVIEKGRSDYESNTADPQVRKLIAKSFFQKSNFDQAIKNFLTVLENNPKDLDSWQFLARAYANIGDFHNEEVVLRKGILEDPDHEALNYQLGFRLLRNGDTTESLKYLVKIKDFSNHDAAELELIAECLINAGYFDQAESILLSNEFVDKKSPKVMRQLLEIQKNKRDFSQLSQIYRSLYDLDELGTEDLWDYAQIITADLDSSYSEKKCESIIEQIYSDLHQYVKDASIARKIILGKLAYHSAHSGDCTQIMSSLITDNSLDTDDLAEAKTWLAHAALDQRNYDLALVAYKETILLDPGKVSAKIGLAKSYYSKELFEEADTIAEGVLLENKEDPKILSWYSGFQKTIGNRQKSLNVLTELVRISPLPLYKIQYAEELSFLEEKAACKSILVELAGGTLDDDQMVLRASKLAGQIGEVQLALDFLTKMRDNGDHYSEGFLLHLASLYRQNGQIGKAIENLSADLDVNPHHIANRAVLADLLIECEKFPQAIANLDLLKNEQIKVENGYLLPFFPDYSEVILDKTQIISKLIDVQKMSGNYEDAFKLADAVSMTHPENHSYRLRAAQLAFEMGDYERAFGLTDLSLFNNKQPVSDNQDKCEDEAILNLAGLRGHLALEKDDVEEARRISQLFPESSSSLVINLLKVRLLALDEGIPSARKLLEILEIEDDSDLWLGPTLAEVDEWEKAFHFVNSFKESVSKRFPAVEKIAAAVEQRIWQEFKLRKMLGIVRRIPSSPLILEIVSEKIRKDQLAESKTSQDLLNSPEDCVTEAILTYENQKYEQCRLVCNRFPRYPTLVWLNALATLEVDPQAAINLAKLGIDLLPKSGYSHRVLGLIAEEMGDQDLAIRAMEHAIDLLPGEDRWHVELSDLYSRVNDGSNEIRHLLEAYTIDTTATDVAKKLGKKYLESQEIQKGIALLEKVLESDSSAEILSEIAAAYAQLGNKELAIHYCQEIERYVNVSDDDFIQCAQIMFAIADYDKAFYYSRKAAIKNPEHPQAIVLLARSLAFRSGNSEGMKILEKAMSQGHQSIIVRKEYAMLAIQERGLDFAGSMIENLLTEIPEDPDLLGSLAILKYSEKDLDSAKQLAIKAIQNNSMDSRVFSTLGQINFAEGNFDKAIEYLSRAMAIDQENADLYLLMVDVLKQRREYTRAIDLLEKAAINFPDHVTILLTLASLHKEGKNYQRAADLLQAASDLSPADISIKRQLGAILALNLVHFSQEVRSIL